MFWVLDGTVTACRMQQHQVADCSIIEHQPASANDRSPTVEQMNTATGGHRDDRWVMTADVVWTSSVGQTAQICSQVVWSRTIQWTIDDCRQLELNTLRDLQPVETGECDSDVVRKAGVNLFKMLVGSDYTVLRSRSLHLLYPPSLSLSSLPSLPLEVGPKFSYRGLNASCADAFCHSV